MPTLPKLLCQPPNCDKLIDAFNKLGDKLQELEYITPEANKRLQIKIDKENKVYLIDGEKIRFKIPSEDFIHALGNKFRFIVGSMDSLDLPAEAHEALNNFGQAGWDLSDKEKELQERLLAKEAKFTCQPPRCDEVVEDFNIFIDKLEETKGIASEDAKKLHIVLDKDKNVYRINGDEISFNNTASAFISAIEIKFHKVTGTIMLAFEAPDEARADFNNFFRACGKLHQQQAAFETIERAKTEELNANPPSEGSTLKEPPPSPPLPLPFKI